MKHILNCHSFGTHSFQIAEHEGLSKRIFYADYHHNLWKPFEIAVHPNHTDIQITVLEGRLHNFIYEPSEKGMAVNKYKFLSAIKGEGGCFSWQNMAFITPTGSEVIKAGQYTHMVASDLHTIYVEQGEKCIWQIVEYKATYAHSGMNYSPYDLSKWSSEGLYTSVDETVARKYIDKYVQRG